MRVAFRLNGTDVTAASGESIIEAADRLGVPIPRLCYTPGMRPDGNCRACMGEITGERVLAPSCCRQPTAGMEVASDSPRAVHAQKIIVELLASDMPIDAVVFRSELDSRLENYSYCRSGRSSPCHRYRGRACEAVPLSHVLDDLDHHHLQSKSSLPTALHCGGKPCFRQ